METKNKDRNCLSFWMDPLSLCLHMKIERGIGCLLEMSLGGMFLCSLDLISMSGYDQLYRCPDARF